MITNFENVTEELSEEELNTFLPGLIAGFKKRTESNPIKAHEIVDGMIKTYDKKFSEVKLRKMVNYIRCQGLLPLIATSKGYYVSYDVQVIKSQIQSLQERANSIIKAKKGLESFL